MIAKKFKRMRSLFGEVYSATFSWTSPLSDRKVPVNGRAENFCNCQQTTKLNFSFFMYPSVRCPHCWVINVEALPLIPLTVSDVRETVILTESIRDLLASINF